MWKLVASVLSLAAVGGPVTVALAAADPEAAPALSRADHRAEVVRFRAVDQVIERRAERAEERAEARRAKRRAQRKRVDVPPALEAIAACESGGDPTAVGGGGAYRGKYQFSRETWASVGGTGDPAAASEAEQDKRAAMLYARDGAGHWPVCGSQ